MQSKNNYLEIKKIIENAKFLVVFTGAGVSVESGIPPFTGVGGLWTQYDPKFIELNYFYTHPKESWEEIKHIFYDYMLDKAKPNLAHLTIGKWSQAKKVKAIITQNIDNLHQAGGSNNVIEFHGTVKTLKCTKCGQIYRDKDISLDSLPPTCKKCNGILKPNFIFYGEGINQDVHLNALKYITKADVLLIIGTSGQVMPANQLPFIAKQQNPKVKIIEVNPKTSTFTHSITDYYFDSTAVEFFKELNKIKP